MKSYIIFMLLLFSISAFADNDMGRVFFGKNYAKPLSEHTDRLYLRINESAKLYVNRRDEGPFLEDLDLNADHVVSVYFDDKIVQSWILNFSDLKTREVLIWRSAGAWRMAPLSERPN